MVSYEYFVLRCVPRVDREEFLNVGVVVYSREEEFLGAACQVDEDRVHALAPEVDIEEVEMHLESIASICRGDEGSGPAATWDLRKRFDWLSSPRSTVVQPGPVHPGLTKDPGAELQHLLPNW